jgi:hypothetical protein
MIPTLERLLAEVESLLSEDLPLRETCSLWLDLVEFRKNVDLVVRSVEEEATELLHAEIGDDERGLAIIGKRSLYETPAGVVRLEREPLRRRAHGRAIVEVLSARLVNQTTGEVVAAVPVEVLRDVLPPAATSEDPSSFGWRFRELREYLGDEYRLLVDEPELADRGVRIMAGEGYGR